MKFPFSVYELFSCPFQIIAVNVNILVHLKLLGVKFFFLYLLTSSTKQC